MLRFALGKVVEMTPCDGHRAVALQNTGSAVFRMFAERFLSNGVHL